MSNEYLSSWGHSKVVITVEWTSLYARHSLRHQTTSFKSLIISFTITNSAEMIIAYQYFVVLKQLECVWGLDCTCWKPYQSPYIQLSYASVVYLKEAWVINLKSSTLVQRADNLWFWRKCLNQTLWGVQLEGLKFSLGGLTENNLSSVFGRVWMILLGKWVAFQPAK